MAIPSAFNRWSWRIAIGLLVVSLGLALAYVLNQSREEAADPAVSPEVSVATETVRDATLTVTLQTPDGQPLDRSATVHFAGLPPVLKFEGFDAVERFASERGGGEFLDPLYRRRVYQREGRPHPLLRVSDRRSLATVEPGTTLEFAAPVAGDYVIFVSCPGYGVEGSGFLTLAADEKKHRTVNFVALPRVSGRVTTANDQPVAGAEVSVSLSRAAVIGELTTSIKAGGGVSGLRDDWRFEVSKNVTGTTDEFGRFEITCPWTKDVTVHIRHSEHGEAIRSRTLDTNFSSLDVDVRLDDPARKRRLVIEYEDGTPAPFQEFYLWLDASRFQAGLGVFRTDAVGLLDELPQLDESAFWLSDSQTHKRYRIPAALPATIRIDI